VVPNYNLSCFNQKSKIHYRFVIYLLVYDYPVHKQVYWALC